MGVTRCHNYDTCSIKSPFKSREFGCLGLKAKKVMNLSKMQTALEILSGPMPLELHEMILDTIRRDYLQNTRAIDLLPLLAAQNGDLAALKLHKDWFDANMVLEIRGPYVYFNDLRSNVLGRSIQVNTESFTNFINLITACNFRIKQLNLSLVTSSEWDQWLSTLIAHCESLVYDYKLAIPFKGRYISQTLAQEDPVWYSKITEIGLLSDEQALNVVRDDRFTNLKKLKLYNNIYKEIDPSNWLELIENDKIVIENTASYAHEIDPTQIRNLKLLLSERYDLADNVEFDVLIGAFDPRDEFNVCSVNPSDVKILELTFPQNVPWELFTNCREVRLGIDQLSSLKNLPRSVKTIIFKPSGRKHQTTAQNEPSNWVLPDHVESLQFLYLDLESIENTLNAILWDQSKLIELRLSINKIDRCIQFQNLPESLQCLDIKRCKIQSKDPIIIELADSSSSLDKWKGIYKRCITNTVTVKNGAESISVHNCSLC